MDLIKIKAYIPNDSRDYLKPSLLLSYMNWLVFLLALATVCAAHQQPYSNKCVRGWVVPLLDEYLSDYMIYGSNLLTSLKHTNNGGGVAIDLFVEHVCWGC